MRDWQAFVRARLTLPRLAPEREARIIRELAAQLEDFYRDALARGASDETADAHACAQVRDWERMAQDVWLADRPHARPRVELLAGALEDSTNAERGVAKMMADVLRDVRYAVRQLIATPGFTIVAVLTLALGIGATGAIFSVVNGVLLRPLPYQDPDRLVRVHEIVPQYGRFSVAPATFLDWRRQNAAFARIAAYTGIAVFLAAVGLYGVVAYTVSLRTQEIGVRVAMGARSGQVLALIVGGGMKLALAGVAIGLAGALMVAKLANVALFGLTPLDPISYVITSAVLLAVAAVACYIPARRATRVDPIVALRQA